jgi:hypothetical protein
VGERLLDAGVAPKHARRAVLELTDHFDDLVAELESQGRSRADAETEATVRLNPEALLAAAIARPELYSWVRRWPLLGCTVFPLGMYMAYVVGSIALIVGGVTIIDHNLGVTLAGSPELQRFAATSLTGVAWAMPIFAAGTFCSIAHARRMPSGWTLIGAVLVSLVGATLNAGLLLPPNDRPGLQAGLGFNTDALAQPLLRAALTLAIVLPIYFWRRAVVLARNSRWSRLIALVAVAALHAAMLGSISARAPRIGANTNDPAMTLVQLPPVTQPPAVVSERATRPAMPSSEIWTPPPTLSTESTPAGMEGVPIDFAHEAKLAARRAADAIELEHEPETVRKPPPEFGWSKTAQRVEALPEGGVLIRLSERCVVVVSLVVLPACAVGEIPANGKLFEHMDDAPTLGDWKDDSALPR